jgi:hypothetical protein
LRIKIHGWGVGGVDQEKQWAKENPRYIVTYYIFLNHCCTRE